MQFGKAIIMIFIIFLSTVSKHLYAEEFTTDYDIRYDIEPNGETQITQNILITNQRNDVIATRYSLSIKQMNIYDVQTIANGKNVDPQKEISDDATTITLNIENYAIGEGRQNKLEIIYKTKDIANKVGDIWNINIPRSRISDTTTLYNVVLSIPDTFGPKLYISPSPSVDKYEGGKYHHYFTKQDLLNNGITSSFGHYQTLNFRIRYQIENPSLLPAIYEIALPPDIKDYQQVSYTKIEPYPNKIKLDNDGNSIAEYKLKSNQVIEVNLIGRARISGRQINPDFGGKFESIPKKHIKDYTKSQKYWEINSPNVQELANKLMNPKDNVSKNAHQIYKYLIDSLNYDFEAAENGDVTRYGAETALSQTKSFTCMEFTDLFIATARAMGIPAREINGYAFTTDKKDKPLSIQLSGGDLLHAWAEYYDSFYGWVQIDPTWGKTSGVDYFTKLDTNHFAFVVKGNSSEYPLPAGTYRIDSNEKLVEVDFSQSDNNDDDFEEKLRLYKKFNFNIIQLLKGNEKFHLKNESNVFVYNVMGKRSVVPPGQRITVYLPKGSSRVEYEKFSGNKVVQNLAVIE